MDWAFPAALQSLKSGLQVDTSLATVAAPLIWREGSLGVGRGGGGGGPWGTGRVAI